MKANELSCRDLMIGDWVYLPSIMSDDKYPVQVLEIQDDCIKYYSGGKKMMVRFEHAESISLTPEILEKNGFVHYDLTDFWMWKKESFEPVHLDKYDKNGWRLRINCDNIPCECKYVHQLQHALRLCGIDKTIEL